MKLSGLTRTQKITIASIAIVVLAYFVLAWHRRWMSDDGLIIVRTVRQFLEGNGPNFNAFERAEPNTSTLWAYILILFAAITRLRVEYIAVFLGIALAVTGLALGMDATRRLHRARGSTAAIVPAGGLIMVAIFPYWDYASSGLETGLCFAFVAFCWWLLVRGDKPRLSAFIFGLGPLVRPDLGIAAIAFFAVHWALHRPPWRTTLKLLAIGVALPVAYEIFRAGYYGTLVPLPALAKSATDSAWSRGFTYLEDSAQPYKMWLPVVVALAMFAFVAVKRALSRRDLILIAAPIATGLINAIYVLRVGGDFMYARMFLVPLLALMLPMFVLPVRRFTIPAIAVLTCWTLYVATKFGDGESHTQGVRIEDERWGYAQWTGKKNPIHSRVFIRADRPASDKAKKAVANGERLFISQLGFTTPIDKALDAPIVYAAGRLGTGGAVAPLDSIVADTLGLAHPLGARITPTLPGYTGHEKVLPWAWMFADFGDPAHDDDNVENTPGYLVRAARRAMQCGELAELLASVREPMSPSRFWKNLTGSVSRTRLVIPNDPVEAEQKFCGNTNIPIVNVSSVFPFEGWSKYGLVDGLQESSKKSGWGHTSKPKVVPGPEWVELVYASPRPIRKIVLYPATGGEGFPLDFTIQLREGGKWVERFRETNYQPRPTGPHEFVLPSPVAADGVRIEGQKLRFLREEYVLQLAEIEIQP
ncbi:MAG: discoidin domain-containing protein [Myxococcota bacterium]|nr:discoidin domain-containing protein [Deltaproteobacteria bacterium]MDQ3336740.1 discoidin domain-containing protein [Myxococcota bacterium]